MRRGILHEGAISIRTLLTALGIVAAAIGATTAAAAANATGQGSVPLSPSCYVASSGDCVERPDSNTSNVTAICRDGSDSHSEHRSGTCSGHHGVAQWCPCGSASDYIPPAMKALPPGANTKWLYSV